MIKSGLVQLHRSPDVVHPLRVALSSSPRNVIIALLLAPVVACSTPIEGSGGSSEDVSSSDAGSSTGPASSTGGPTPTTGAPGTTNQTSGVSTTGPATTGSSLTGPTSQTTQTTIPEPTTGGVTGDPSTTTTATTSVDEPTTGGCEEQLWYLDEDNDGCGLEGEQLSACEQPDGYAPEPGDCDDDKAEVNPGQAELCDDLDNDCDGLANEFSEQNTTCEDCELAVFEGSQYAFCDATAEWPAARANCEARGPGFDLMRVDDMPEQTFLAEHIIGAPSVWWLGANDLAVEGEWLWNNGDGVYDGYHNWQPGDPDDNMNSDCMIADNDDADWLDRPCADQYRWVCEGPA